MLNIEQVQAQFKEAQKANETRDNRTSDQIKKDMLADLKKAFPKLKFTIRIDWVGYTAKYIVSLKDDNTLTEYLKASIKLGKENAYKENLKDKEGAEVYFKRAISGLTYGLNVVYNTERLKVLQDIKQTLEESGKYYNNSDIMTDYFDYKFYLDIILKPTKNFIIPSFEELYKQI